MKTKVFLAILLSVMFISSVLAQSPFDATLKKLPGEQRPKSLANVLGYIQFIPYSLWILRNPTLWAYCLSILPTFISEIPTLFQYLHYYILQTPGALNQLFRLVTSSLDTWLDTLIDDFFYVLTNFFSIPLKFIFRRFSVILQNSAGIFYEFCIRLPYILNSFEKLLEISPEIMISATPSIIGAISVILPQFVPLSFSFVSYVIDWTNIFIEAIPRLFVNFNFNLILAPFQLMYDGLYSIVYLLSIGILSSLRSTIRLITTWLNLIPQLPEILQNFAILAEVPQVVNQIPNFIMGFNLFITALITSLLASIPTIALNSLYSLSIAMPIVLSTSFKVLGASIFLPIKGLGAVFGGIPAYFLSKISYFLFITLPKNAVKLTIDFIKLTITGMTLVLSKLFALPWVIMYRLSSLPYDIIAWISIWIRSLADPLVQYFIRTLSLKFATP